MQRKAIKATLTGLILLVAVSLIASPGYPRVSAVENLRSVDDVAELKLSAIEPAKLIAEDAAKASIPGPLRFALPADVEISTSTHGSWEHTRDGSVWRLRVTAPNATDINFGFTRYRLPKGATLHLVSLDYDFVRGPFTVDENNKSGEFWSPMIPGERALIELFVPYKPAFAPELVLGRVGRGYRDMFRVVRGMEKQGSCNNDVICPEGAGWGDEIRSVGVYSRGGSLACTGTLINNVAQNGRPFFITANHCGVTSSTAGSVVVYWNYESPSCGQLGGGSLSQSTSGATFRASDYANDMTLIELNSIPSSTYDVFYSGWDARTTTVPQSSVGIHHPSTDEKAISFNDDPLTTGNSCINTGGTNSHWWVDNWEDGTTEPGSSGSGLFDPNTHLLVGYLSGGQAACGNSEYDCYGKMSVGWSLGLSSWLDPSNTGTRYVLGMNPDGGGGGGGSSVLSNGVPVTGLSGVKGNEIDYTMSVPSNGSNLSFVMSGGTGDADLYVKFGSAPSTSSYDCRPYKTGNEETCSFASPSTGTYYVMIRAYSTYSGVALTGSFQTQQNQAPDAGFTFSTSDLAASFTDQSSDSDGSISSRSWNFGDGSYSSLSNPSHTYGSGGTYTVTLTVTDDDGATDSVSKSVTVTEPSSSPCTGCDEYSGTLTGTGDVDYHPNGTYYYAGSSGTHYGWLEGPSSADFDLELYKWTGSRWSKVASSTSGSSSESIAYSATSGYYYWRIFSYSGSGSYDLWLDTP